MDRIDHATADADLYGSGKDGFTAGSVATQVPATVVTADWLNGIQEEIASVIEHAATPLAGRNDQMLAAIRGMVDGAALAGLTARTTSAGPYYEGAASNNSGSIVAVARDDASAQVVYSTNGGNFVSATLAGGSTEALHAILFVDTQPDFFASGTFLVVGENGTIQWSDDCATWTAETPAASYTGDFLCAAKSPDTDVVVIAGTGGEIQTSSNIASSWSHATQPGAYAGSYNGCTYSPRLGLWILCGTSGAIHTSPDGSTWTARTSALAGSIHRVHETPNGLIAIGAGGDPTLGVAVSESADGITWASRMMATKTTPTVASFRVDETTGAITFVQATRLYHGHAISGAINYRCVLPTVTTGAWLQKTKTHWVAAVGSVLYTSSLVTW